MGPKRALAARQKKNKVAKKSSDGAAASEDDQQQRVAAFLQWMRDVGIWWDDSLIEITTGFDCTGIALGVRAKREVR